MTSKFGFDFEIIPDFSYIQNSKIIEQTAEQFKEYCDVTNKYPKEGDVELIQQMNKQLTECPENIELKHIDKFNVKDMKFKEEKDGGKLSKVSTSAKEKRVNMIWHFNYFFFQL